MQKSKSIRIPKATRYQNAAIDYYMGLTKSSYLHYGYWEEPPASEEELTLTHLRLAQEAYAVKLFSFIPEKTKTLLDVGCGVGGNTKYLCDRGFAIEALAPDALQKEKFLENTQNKVPFHLTTFEEFQQDKLYDLVLFSESSQYIAVDDLAQGAARLLGSGSYLLIADMMRLDAKYQEGIFSNCHVREQLKVALEKVGFTLIKSEDISRSIAPTLDLCLNNFSTFGITTGKYIGDVIKIAVPPVYALLNWAFKRWLDEPIREGLAARKIFDSHLCYEIQLWQLSKI